MKCTYNYLIIVYTSTEYSNCLKILLPICNLVYDTYEEIDLRLRYLAVFLHEKIIMFGFCKPVGDYSNYYHTKIFTDWNDMMKKPIHDMITSLYHILNPIIFLGYEIDYNQKFIHNGIVSLQHFIIEDFLPCVVVPHENIPLSIMIGNFHKE